MICDIRCDSAAVKTYPSHSLNLSFCTKRPTGTTNIIYNEIRRDTHLNVPKDKRAQDHDRRTNRRISSGNIHHLYIVPNNRRTCDTRRSIERYSIGDEFRSYMQIRRHDIIPQFGDVPYHAILQMRNNVSRINVELSLLLPIRGSL